MVLVLADIALVGLALWTGYTLRFELEIGALETFRNPPADEYFKIYLLFAAVIMLLCQGWGLYRLHSLRSTIEETSIIAKSVTFATVFVLASMFFYRGFVYSRATFAFFWVLCIVFMSVAHALFRGWQLRRYQRGLDRQRTAFVGRNLSYLAHQLATDSAFGLQVAGYIDPNGAGTPDAGDGPIDRDDPGGMTMGGVGTLVRSARAVDRGLQLERLGTVSEIASVLDTYPIEELFVVDQDLTHKGLLQVLDACEPRGIKVRMVPAIYDLLVGPEDFTYVHNVPLIRVDERRYHRLTRFLKRVFDVVVSGTLLLTLWPIALLIALVIRLETKGPALFVQIRAGESGKPFGMYKFRTMVDDAEGRLGEVVDLEELDQPAFKVKNDPRITRVGKVLRRTSIDELPQLWNVLKGEMSLVGPRPEELRVADRYDVWQRRRLKVRPGITGLQQVEARGALSSLNDRVRLDVYYIRKQSLMLDLAILVRTVWAVIRGTGAT